MSKKFWRRLLGSTLLMLLALATTAGLGAWQYTVAYRNDVVNQVESKPAVELQSVTALGEYLLEANYGQAVFAQGKLDCAEKFKVDFAGSRTAWEICRFELQNGDSIAAAFISAPATFNDEIELTARIQPAHSVDEMPVRYLPASVVTEINTDDLVMRWQRNVLDGYLAVTETAEIESAEFLGSELIEWPPVGIQLRNLFYAWQWWIFAAFTVFIWAKFTLDDYRALIRKSEMD